MSLYRPPVSTHLPPPLAMIQLISGFWVSRAIYAAAKLGIADLVRDQPGTIEQLAEATQTHAPSLYRLLRALAGVGVFAQDEDGRFGLTPLARTLLSDVPGSLRAFAVSELGEAHYPAWGDLMHSIKTGEVAFNHAFGMEVFQYFAQNPETARIFDQSMSGLSAVINQAILSAYDFSSFGRVVDVGGGQGALVTSILKAYPQARGVLFDAPSVIEGARHRINAEGLADRCELIAGDFFRLAPAGGDAYLLKWIIHDWDDERSRAILQNCRRAMAAHGKILVIEAIIPGGNEPFLGKFIDLNMMVMTGGRERTEAEYRRLLERAGFALTRIAPTLSEMSVIEGIPA